MNAVSGVTFEKDVLGNDRYIRIDLNQHVKSLYPFLVQAGIILDKPQGWDEALTSEQFLCSAKKILKKKFDDRGKVS
jgi:hypothetical protein